ncbi:MAG: hypothetical protein P8P99_06655 [Maricaulis sp.]|jgi:hypothetical protein|nr:hypothetical protein [Maricaulis sp.]
MSDGQTYLEITVIGNSVRVAAIDAATGEEVIFQAPRNTPRPDLEKLAIQKLSWKMAREAEKTDGTARKKPGAKPGRGFSV